VTDVTRGVTRGAAALVLALAACAPRPSLAPRGSSPEGPPAAAAPRAALPVPLEAPPHHEEPGLAGVVHVVRRGETIYRIAKSYGVDPADLLESNGISDPRAVAAGTELFVPGASRVVELSPGDGAAAAPAPAAAALPAAPSTPTDPGAAPPAPASRPVPAPAPGPSAAREDGSTPLAWPLKGVLYGRYGVRAGQRHDGIDIAAPEGAPVRAAADGTVIFADDQPGYGALVILKHANDLVTLYAHNSRVLVKDGQRVSRGDPIARVGQTGRTTGPHLHFEVRQGTRPRNPLLFLP
jgi:lipoprotein NlpD